jgi:hypothetical protein
MRKYLTILILSSFFVSCSTQKVEFEVTSQQIYKEFQDNEVAALSKYKGKKIKVTGELISFTNIMGDNFCYIGSHGDLIGEVQCKMSDEFSKKAGNYKVGQKITLEGVVEGMLITGVVQIQ